jgi:hypothetical protein
MSLEDKVIKHMTEDQFDKIRKLIFIDACQKGAAGEKFVYHTNLGDTLLKHNLVIYYSSSSGQASYPDTESTSRMGIFTKYLAMALEGAADGFDEYINLTLPDKKDGELTKEELMSYLRKKVPSEVITKYPSAKKRQEPFSTQGKPITAPIHSTGQIASLEESLYSNSANKDVVRIVISQLPTKPNVRTGEVEAFTKNYSKELLTAFKEKLTADKQDATFVLSEDLGDEPNFERLHSRILLSIEDERKAALSSIFEYVKTKVTWKQRTPDYIVYWGYEEVGISESKKRLIRWLFLDVQKEKLAATSTLSEDESQLRPRIIKNFDDDVASYIPVILNAFSRFSENLSVRKRILTACFPINQLTQEYTLSHSRMTIQEAKKSDQIFKHKLVTVWESLPERLSRSVARMESKVKSVIVSSIPSNRLSSLCSDMLPSEQNKDSRFLQFEKKKDWKKQTLKLKGIFPSVSYFINGEISVEEGVANTKQTLEMDTVINDSILSQSQLSIPKARYSTIDIAQDSFLEEELGPKMWSQLLERWSTITSTITELASPTF